MSLPERRPASLGVAAVLLGLQALVVLVYGVLGFVELHLERLALGLGVSVIMVGLGVVLLAVTRGVYRARRWSRSLSVLSQLLVVLLGWNFRQPPTSTVGGTMMLVGVVTLVCLLVPASTRAFVGQPEPEPEDEPRR